MQFAKAGAREKVKFASRLTAHGDELREAALAGCGTVGLLAWHVEDELRTGALVQVLPDWECLGGLPIVASYRKRRPRLSPAFASHLLRAFEHFSNVAFADLLSSGTLVVDRAANRVADSSFGLGEAAAQINPIEALLGYAMRLDKPQMCIHGQIFDHRDIGVEP
jgi:hypothetical protein